MRLKLEAIHWIDSGVHKKSRTISQPPVEHILPMQEERVCRNAKQEINGRSDIDVRSGIRQIYTIMYDPRCIQQLERNIEIQISLIAAVPKRAELSGIA